MYLICLGEKYQIKLFYAYVITIPMVLLLVLNVLYRAGETIHVVGIVLNSNGNISWVKSLPPALHLARPTLVPRSTYTNTHFQAFIS